MRETREKRAGEREAKEEKGAAEQKSGSGGIISNQIDAK